MSLPPPLVPPTALAHYRVLSPTAGVRVSPLQLGAMSIGDKWAKAGMGSMDKESSFKLLDAYFDAGGNFIDTANAYQEESSEEFIGEWTEARGIRDQLYSASYKRSDPHATVRANYVANSAKALYVSVEDSLKKLRTNYIDILYIHWWDYETSIPEVMGHLHNLVAERKVIYLGASDTPAWVVAKANQWARDHGKTPFSIYQGQWNVLKRSFEREIIPMARLALAPWDVLAAGRIRTDAEEEARRQSGEKGRTVFQPDWERNADERAMSHALEKVAKEVGAKTIQAVAIAYLLHKTPYVFPIVGGRKIEHLHANIEALSIALSKEQIAYLESILPFDPGFPSSMIGDGTYNNRFIQGTGRFDHMPLLQPIKPEPKN
ncbi:hypothetical protein EVG20_g4052 [Dentipellis fragilis]|uniref:NADP-dependent oxidoreductase domain-containing protein n=1 Tax=Dentipellis fragilis TaxID=205917 RepID=A0A4Y9YZB8_9AGAM|nr:hypothetical protein EVG20_g4052 [Dentipellis fragilis]